MNVIKKDGLEKSSVCELCPAGNHCGQLKTALTILRQRINDDLSTNEELQKYYSSLLRLEEANWDYPFNKDFCDFKDEKNQVCRITEILSQVLNETPH